MALAFDFSDVRTTEFGVGLDKRDVSDFVCVPVDASVQVAIREMAQASLSAMQDVGQEPSLYEPSEKHAGEEYLYLPAENELTKDIRRLYNATNLPISDSALKQPQKIFCYFGRFTDGENRRLLALRRATQFKGILKPQLIRVVNDTLKIVEDKIFKLDSNFDVLIDSERTHILRPSSFEFLGNLKEAILGEVPKNIGTISQDLPFVDLGGVQEYASTRPRAARYLASIRTQNLKNISVNALATLCQETGVAIEENGGLVSINDGHMMGFLEVLDRRRYRVDLVANAPERFRAASRSRI